MKLERIDSACRVCALAIFAAAAFASSGSVAAIASPDIGAKAPEYLGRSSSGHKVLLSSYAGKVVVVSFWASWCAPCRKELPVLENLQRAGKGEIQVIAVNTEDQDVFRSVLAAMQGFTLLLANDAGSRAQAAYGVKGFPHMVIIDREGIIQNVHSGYGDGVIDRIVEEVNAALAVRASGTSDARP
jgi:thiol-disulfide isomerase/thioredoxin